MRELGVLPCRPRGKRDWALASVDDIEAFLGTRPRQRNRRLIVLRQLFRLR